MSTATKRRITVAEVREAMAKTGLRLRRDCTLIPESKCGCPIGIIAAANGFDVGDSRFVYVDRCSDHIGLDKQYRCAFVDAFDGYSPHSVTDPDGVADGLAVVALLLEQEQS